ncbi:MAG: hypothetical protein A2W95_16875 [Bacteroidetes bacterium GWA2_40_14]|nr:MAG: hypothetical protein A2W95_16875 [Bacteroidetes bacterium GWA2_40_14]
MINKYFITINMKRLLLVSIVFINSIVAFSQTTFSGTGNWSDGARWDNGIPASSTDVTIADGAQCTVDVAAECQSLTFAANSTNTLVTISGANSITMSGTLAYSAPSADVTQTIDIGTGSLVCGAITMTNTSNGNRKLNLNISTGTVTVNGDIVMAGSNTENYITFTDAGILNVTGNLGTGDYGRLTGATSTITIGGNFDVNVFTANTCTINFNGTGNQRIDNGTYYNLTLDNGGTKYLVAATTINTGGTLTLNNGLLNLAGFDLTVTATATFAGTPSASSMINFTNGGRLVKTGTIAADWQRTYPIGTGADYSPAVLSTVVGSDYNGTMYIKVVGERHPLLNGADNAIKRYWDFSSTNLTFTSITGSLTYTDNDVSSPITEGNLTKTGRLYSGWTENQAGTSYDHGNNQLTFSATSAIFGTWTLGENTGCFDASLPDKYTVANGNWNTGATWNNGTVPSDGNSVEILHAVTRDVAVNPSNLTISSTGSLNLNTVAITVTGTTDLYGQLTDGSNTGINTFQGKVTVYAGGTWTTTNETTSGEMIFQGGLVNNGTFNAGSGDFTATQDIEGTSPINFANAIRIGTGNVVTNKNTSTVSITGTLDGIGAGAEWINDVNTTLNYKNATQPFNTNGTLTATANPNTVIYGLNGAQTIRTTGTTYHHLNIEGGNTKTASGALTINGNLTYQNLLATALLTTTTNNVAITGNLVAANSGFAATLTQTTGTLSATNLNANGGNTFYLNSNASFSQAINLSNNSTLTLNTGGASLFSYNVGNDINVASGSSFTNGTSNYTNSLTVTGNLIIDGTFDLWYDGDSRTNLIVNGNVAHSFSGTPTAFQLYNFTINPSSNTTTAGFAFDMEGSVNIGTGSTFDAGAFVHTVLVDWTNAGTLASAGTFTFDGGTQNIGAESNFNHVTFSTAGTKTFTGNLALSGDLNISNATVYIGNNTTPRAHQITGSVFINSGSLYTNNVDVIHALSVGGNLTVNGNLDLYINTIRYTNLTITGNVAHSIDGTPTIFDIYNLNLGATSNKTTLGFDILTSSTDYIRNDISIGNGATLDMNTKDLDVYGNITIAAGGEFQIDENAVLTYYAASKSVQNSGTLSIVGTAGNLATLTASATGNRFYIDNASGASLVMKYFSVDYLTGNGITVATGGTADGTADNFSYGTFGTNCNSSQCLQLSGANFSTNNPVTATNTVFNNPSGYNVNRASGIGTINFVDATGTRAGESFDNDNGNPGTLINWTYPGSTYYTVSSGDFLNPAIWNADPTGHFTDASAVFQIMDSHNVTLNGDIDVLELIVGNGVSGSLIIGNDATIRNLTTRENLTVQTGGAITVGSSAIHEINIYGNFNNSGSTNLRASSSNVANVNFYGPSSKVNGGNTIAFNTVTFKTGTITTAHTSMDVNRSVIIENGAVFNDGDLSHTVARDWTETGTGVRTGSGTIVFDGTVSTIAPTDATAINFYHVTCSGAGAVDFASTTVAFSTNILGDFTVSDTKEVQLTDDAFNVAGNFSVATTARFTSNTALVTLNGTSNQAVNLAGDVTFYDLAFNGASTKTVTGDITTTRYLTINTGAVADGTGNHEIGSNLTIDGTCNFSGSITMKGGNITSNNPTLSFALLPDLNIAGNIYITTASSLDVSVNGNVTIQSGYLVINSNTNLSGTGTFTLGAGFNLYVRDDNGFPSGFAAYNMATNSSVLYDRDMDQVIRGGAGLTYGNLYLENAQNANAHNRTADGTINVVGNIRFETDPITFNLAGYDFTINGNITNATAAIIDMTAGGTLTLDADDAIQTMGVATYNLTNLAFTLASPSATRTKTITSGATLNLLGNFTATCGSTGSYLLDIVLNDNSIGGTPQNLTLGQNCRLSTTATNVGTAVLNNFLGTVDLTNGTVHFTNNTATQYIPHGVTYGNIALSNTYIKEATGDLNINGDILVVTATPYFRAAGFTINIAGNWQLGTANTRVADLTATDTVVFNGIDQTIYPSNFQHLEIANTGIDSLSGPAGNLSVYGGFTVKTGATFAAKGRNLIVNGNWTVENSGVFTQDIGGTVSFTGTTADQTIQSNINSYFGNVTITKNTGAGNQTVTANTDIVIKRNLILTTDASIFDLNNHQLNVGGNFYVNSNTYAAYNAFIPGTGTVIFDGTDIQEIRHYSAYPLTFHNITFSTTTNKMFRCLYNPAVIEPTRSVIVTGNWTNNGQNVYAYIIGDGNTYVNFEVAGNWVNNGTFYHLNTGTVTFNGADQSIGASDFWNVVFAGTGIKTLHDGQMTVKRNLTINDGVTLDVNSVENNNILVSLNWDMSAAGAVFEARQGLVRFDGGGTITTGHADENTNKNFYNIEFSANFTVSGDLDVDNDFTILSGTFTTGINKIFIGGSFYNSGTFTQTNNASAQVIFNATGGAKQIDPGTGVNFRSLTINATGGTTYELLNNFSLYSNYDFTINQGAFNLNSHDITVYDANTKIVINAGAEFIVNESSNVIFTNNNQSIRNQGGTFKLVGLAGNAATLTKTAGTFYVTQSSGVFHARYYRCEGIGAGTNGCITINGGSLDSTNNFSNGIFISGASTATSTAYIDLNGLPIDNVENLTMDQVTFNSGGTTNRNIKRDVPPADPNNGYVECQDCIGSLAGPIYETDDASPSTGFVRWTYPNGFFWQGDVSADWHNDLNWEGGTSPYDSSHYVYLNQSNYVGPNPVATVLNANEICGRIIINDGGAGLGIALDNGYDLEVFGAVVVSNGGSISVLNAGSEITVHGDWTNSGTFAHGNGKINLEANNEPITITAGATNPFYDLQLYSSQAATFSLGSNLDINNDLTFVKGTFDVLTRDITIGGDWLMVADSAPVFVPKTRTVTFDGAKQTVSSGTFYNLTKAGTDTLSLLTNIEVNGNLTIGAATTLNGLESELYLALNWINNGSFTQTGNGMVIFDGGNQQIDNTGATTTRFNKVTFAGTGTKTFYKASEIWGDVVVNSGCGVDFSTYVIDGGVPSNIFTNNGSIYLGGVDNFPTGFETISMSNSSNVFYRYAGGDQVVKNSTAWSYGNLYLQNNSTTNYNKVPEAGDLKVTGSLIISHTDVVLDMATNSANLILTGNITFPTGGQQIVWGTGTTKLTHIGGDWGIDTDITGFNNIEFGGTVGSWKVMNNNLSISGNATVKNGIYLLMDPWNYSLPKTMTCTGVGKTFTMENNARLYNATPSATDVAMPKGFTTYSIHSNSAVYLRAPNGTDQTIYTDNNITYGMLTYQNTKTVTTDGISTLRVAGNLNMGTCIFTDAGQSIITGGATTAIYDYTPTPGVTFTFNGVDQAINNTNQLRFENVVFSGTGTKILGSASTVLINGNATINPNITVTSGRNITFNGATWANSGKYRHSATLTVSGSGAQSINPGSSASDNYFTNIDFAGTNAVSFISNGADFNGTLTISSTASVSMGAFPYTIYGSVTNTAGGTWNTASADITFDGGNQNINTPSFTANNVTINGTGTKRMYSNWDVNNLNIIASTLNNYDNISAYFALTVRGNYANTGTFTHNDQSLVTFNAPADVSINNGTGTFWVVNFGDDTGSTNIYNLIGASTTIRRTINLYEDAHVKLNGNVLTFGYNTANPKIFTVKGILDIDANASLQFQNQTSICSMLVDNASNPSKAILRIVGNNQTEVATITRSTTGGQAITINRGNIEAKYYLIEYLANAGIDIQSNATLHATNNFSYGTFSNINNVAGACYLNLEAGTYAGGNIIDVTFNCSTAPVTGVFNVKRQVSSPNITFSGVLSGNLGSYKYEKDELSAGPPAILADATQGKLQWPGVLETVWTGASNSNWDDAANWSDGVPSSTIDAIIPGSVPNDPIMNVNGECKKLRITSGVLELDGGFNITAFGDITIGEGTSLGKLIVSHNESNVICGGSWTRGSNGTFINGNATVIFNSSSGNVTIVPLTSNFYNVEFNNTATTFYLSGSTINILGSLVITNGTVVPNTASYTLNLGGNFDNQGTYTPGTGTTNFNGGVDQTITNGDFYNVTVNGTGTKYISGTCTINGTTTINSMLQANPGSSIAFLGDVTIALGATFNDGNQNHTFSGTTWTGTGNYSGSGTVTFNRTVGNQTVTASTFHNLTAACTGRVLTLTGNLDITGDLTVAAGVTRLDILDKLITNTSGMGTFTVENSATVYITGANHFPTGFVASNLGTSTTVDYRGDGNQIVGGGTNVRYGNLTLTNANTKTLGGDIEIQGNLNFNTATFDVTTNNYSISITGNWNNNNATGGLFIPRQGEVVFNRNGNQTINVADNSANPFYSITLDKLSGTVSAPNNKDQTIGGNLIVTNGIYSANGHTSTIGGDLYAENGSFAYSGTFLLNKTSGSARIRTNYNYSSNTNYLNSITINSGATFTLESDFASYGDFILTTGTFNGNGYRVALGNYSTDNINIDGHYILGAGGILMPGDGCSVVIGSAGSIEVVGTGSENAIVTNNMYYGGRYGFTCNGTIDAEYYQFQYMNINGIRVTSTGVIDATHNFSNGTFTNGSYDGKFLVIENSQSFVAPNYIYNVSFPTVPGGTLSNNVEKTQNSGTLEFWEATGPFSGQLYEKDDYNRINWTGVLVLTWNGSASTNWNNAANWTANIGPNIVPTGAENVVIANVTNKPKLTVSGQLAKKLTINTGARLTLETDYNSGNPDLEIAGDLEIVGSGTLEVKSINDYVSVEGNWTIPNTATFTNNGHITFNGDGSVKTIDNGNKTFYNLNIEGTTVYTLARSTTIRNDLNIALGSTLDASAANYSITIAGNWGNAGSFIPNAGLVTFNATTGPRTIDNSTSSFHHVTINAPAVNYSILNNNMKINGNFTISAGTFNQNQLSLNMGDGTGTDYLYVTGTGNFLIGPNGTLKMGANAIATIYDGGTFKAVGTDKFNPAIITRQTSGTYSFTVENLGNFAAQYYQFEYMDAYGIYLKSGATLEAGNNLSNGIFSNGKAGGTYLTLENTLPSEPADEIIDNVTFNSGPTYNVTRLTGTTVANFKDASGTLGVFNYENDAVMPADPITGLLTWSNINSTYWTGNGSDNNWHNPANWLCNCIPGSANNVTISPDAYNPIISDAAASAKRITIENGAVLTVNGQNLSVDEDIWFEGTFTVTGSPNISTGGSWTNSGGTFNADNSTVQLMAVSGTYTVTQGTGNFNNVEINSGGGYNLLANLQVNNNITLTSGNLNSNSFDIYVGGDWSNTGGTFTPGTKTVYFNGTGSNIINAGGSSFYNISFTGNATTLLNSNLVATNQYTQSAGVVDLSSDGGTTNHNLTINNRLSLTGGSLLGRNSTISVGENWSIAGTGTFTAGTSTVILTNNTGTKSITPRSQAFYNLTINGTATFNLSGALVVNNNLAILAGGLSVTNLDYPITVSGNWSNNGTFAPYTGTVTFNGSLAQTLSGSATHNFGTLVLNNTGATGLTFSSPANINTALTLTDGILFTSALNLLTFNDNATSSSGSNSSFINGPAKKVGNDAFSFPLGDSTFWAPLEITAPSLVTDAFTVEYVFAQNPFATYPCTNCNPSVNGVSRIEYWDITRSNGTSTPNVTLYFKDMDRSKIVDLNDLIFAHYDGSEWVQMGTNTGISDGANMCHVTGTGFTSYSPVLPASESGINPLPIELIAFDAVQYNNDVLISWATLSETNNDYFTLERSTDGESFTAIAQIKGAGNSVVERQYKSSDNNLPRGVYYYRLKQTDFDGLYTFSSTVSVGVSYLFESTLKVYPNPSTNSNINISYIDQENSNIEIKIIDMLGKTLFLKEYQLIDGYLSINLENECYLMPGTYYIILSNNQKIHQVRFSIAHK